MGASNMRCQTIQDGRIVLAVHRSRSPCNSSLIWHGTVALCPRSLRASLPANALEDSLRKPERKFGEALGEAGGAIPRGWR